MFTRTSTVGMEREDWLRLRKTGIGGSDAGAICGLNPFSNPVKVFCDKTGSVLEEPDSEAMRQGRDLEEYVARRFAEETGKKVRRSNYVYRSTEHPFMIANVDRLIVGEDAGLECKTASAYGAEQWRDGNVPLHYIIQCHHYMAVTNRRSWYIAAVVLGRDFTYRRLEWDDGIIRRMVEMEEEFWNKHVVPGIVPPPNGSKTCDRALDQYFHPAGKQEEVALVGFDDKLRRREELLARMGEMETERRRIEQEIKIYMKDHEAAASDRYRVSWKSVDTARVDTRRMRLERPDVYRDYVNVSHSRRFSVKAS